MVGIPNSTLLLFRLAGCTTSPLFSIELAMMFNYCTAGSNEGHLNIHCPSCLLPLCLLRAVNRVSRYSRSRANSSFEQTPDLSSLTPVLDGYIPRTAMDNSAFFTNPAGGYTTLQGEDYTLAPHRDASASFGFDMLPAGETMPRAFPGTGLDPTVTTGASPGGIAAFSEMDPTNALYNSRDSSEDCLTGNQNSQSHGPFDASYSFLPSPPDADEGANKTNITTPAISPKQTTASAFGMDSAGPPMNENASATNKQRVERKKRRRHSTPVVSTTDNGKNALDMPGDEKRRSTTQLRTASRAPKRYSQSTARKPAETPEEVKARAAHNQVEQQYRKRLNAQFERLLAVLPQPDYDDEAMDEDGGGGGEGGGRVSMEKRISKAEVLDLARRRIKALEKERASLERQNEELIANERRMQDEWSRRLGGPMPTVKVER